jgi:hypothetical protein
MLKTKNPKVDEWKVVRAKVKGKKKNFKPTADQSNWSRQLVRPVQLW